MRTVSTIAWNGFLNLLYPPKCLVCGVLNLPAGGPICDSCRRGYRIESSPCCYRCGASTDGVERLCAECASGKGWSFAQARAAGHFSGPLRDSILLLKYGEKRRLAIPLGGFLADYLCANPFDGDPPDMLVPVPLHRSRERERGFNQSTLIARETGRILNLPVADSVVVRTRRTRPQAGLGPEDRISNIRDAFRANESPILRRKTVVLVDDVLTTLNTVNECARVLVDAGAKCVFVLGVSRGH